MSPQDKLQSILQAVASGKEDEALKILGAGDFAVESWITIPVRLPQVTEMPVFVNPRMVLTKLSAGHCRIEYSSPLSREDRAQIVQAFGLMPVPEKRLPDDGNGDEDSYNAGWNACRAALLGE